MLEFISGLLVGIVILLIFISKQINSVEYKLTTIIKRITNES